MDKITFGNKVDTKVTSVAEINKVTGANLNEIKSVTNLAVNQLELNTPQIAKNKEDITSLINGNGKTYISVSNAMAALPLPSDNNPFTIRDSVSNLEDGYYIYLSTEAGGYKFLKALEALANGYYVVNSLLDFDSLISNASSGVWMVISDITLDANKTIPTGVILQFRDSQINLGGFTLTGTDTKIDAGLVQIFDTNGNLLGDWNVKSFYPEWFGALGDGVTDDKLSTQACINSVEAINNKVSILFSGDYYISNSGLVLSNDNHYLYSENGSKLLCERTYFVDQGGGVYTVGQGNIINADGITNVTIKGLTLVGSYEQAWGYQFVYANDTPDGLGSKLLFLKDCNNVNLDDFHIIDAYSSYSTNPTDYINIFGYNPILITGCDGVKINNCSWTKSTGEGWHVYNSNNVKVQNCNFENDYGVSWLDITYCTKVQVTDSSFLKNLESDSGDLLNVPSSEVIISNNNFLNGNIDVGNEYLNRQTLLGQSFVCANINVVGNTIVNGFIQFGTTDATFTAPWAHENINIADNVITIDLDTRPAANGTTVLNYSAITLPQYKNSRNISVSNNTIIAKGALQTGGTPTNLNNLRLINSVTAVNGYTRKNISITNNNMSCDFSNYDSDLLNTLSGAILIQRGIWENLKIEGNVINSPRGIIIDRHESIIRCSIKNNDVLSENFLNIPFTFDHNIDGLDINENIFNFYNTVGHAYSSSDVDSRGFGAFVNMWVGGNSNIARLQIKNNNIRSVVFTFISNFNATTHFDVFGIIRGNTVNFIDFLEVSIESPPPIYPFRFGRVTGETAPSTLHLIDNYFYEDSASTVVFTTLDVKSLDFISNQFIGNYSFTVTTDNVSGVAASRLLMKNNLADNSLAVNYGNMTSANLQEISENSTNFSYGGFNKINAVLVANLQSAVSAGEGARAFVTDSTVATFATVVTGGGVNNVPVYSNGTNWLIG
tara:strand:- start:1638 stop:4484 length:2847 start_codon:yes stop_codon:yes gene_type:complete